MDLEKWLRQHYKEPIEVYLETKEDDVGARKGVAERVRDWRARQAAFKAMKRP